MENFDIDAVITWVDGNDPVWRRKKDACAKGSVATSFDDIAGNTRYASVGEIKYCVASLLQNAPFLRKIFIVSPGQDPHLEDMVSKHFPDTSTKVVIVNQDTLFEGLEDCLPVFNSLSVESLIWRIPDLSEHFIYFNDDFLVAGRLYRNGLFTEEGRPICYSIEKRTLPVRLWRALKPSFRNHKRFGLKDAMLNAADALGGKSTYLYFGHAPNPMLKSMLSDFYASHPELLRTNVNHRFRDPEQFHPQELFCLIARDAGILVVKPLRPVFLYIKPKKNRPDYIKRTLKGFDACPDALFCCFNSLDKASKEDRHMVAGWICRRLGLDCESL